MQRLELSASYNRSFTMSEAYKVIRSNLTFLGPDVKAILFTSAFEGEGKSTVSFRVAKSFAKSGKSVVYLDADMRKSTFIARYRITERPIGLSHYLSAQASLNDVVYSTNYENLYVIPAGLFPPNPSELLTNPLFEEAIKKLKETFDYVIIDAPPVSAATDPAIISSCCDGTVFVIGAGITPTKIINESIEQIKRSGKPILGSILNLVDYKYFAFGYKKYYGRYYGIASKAEKETDDEK